MENNIIIMVRVRRTDRRMVHVYNIQSCVRYTREVFMLLFFIYRIYRIYLFFYTRIPRERHIVWNFPMPL